MAASPPSAYTDGRLSRMPNKPATPQHTVRVTREEWSLWERLAHPRSVSEVIRGLMRQWVKRELRRQQQEDQ